MIKINKSLVMADVPKPLKPPFKQYFAPNNIYRGSRTTAMRRNELIRNGSYKDLDIYSSRYKLNDIKIALVNLYKNKCAFCEQKVEQFHVEHYRPKQIYYWLAYSWDNLISACQFCNEHKSINFRINGPQASLTITLGNLKQINHLSSGYDLSERPDMVNPEVTDPSAIIDFQKDGGVSSADPRLDYTINTCRISRTYLRDRRRKILDDLRRDLKAVFVEHTSIAEQGAAIKSLISKFDRDAKDEENEFLAFRNYVITHWLKSEVKNAKP